MNTDDLVPARRALHDAVLANARNGHENDGFLSPEHGFMPASPPRTRLPDSHRAWDELAAQLPELYRTLRLRRALETLETLPAGRADLPDADVLRASTLLSILAHAYCRAEAGSPSALPPALLRPWQTISGRLGRRAPVLSYIDLIIYNWRWRDSARQDDMRVERLALLVPTVDNREEHVFYLTQVEILARCAPVVGAVVRAQEAIVRDDPGALSATLLDIAQCLSAVTRKSLMMIDPRPLSPTYVDPVVWAKTVAPFAVPIHQDVPGPSGTSSPLFSLLDLFFGRRDHRSALGQEVTQLRTWYPPHWRAFLQAVAACPAAPYVAARGLPALTGCFQDALNAYAGDSGFLGRHRRKVYGYLELAFKVGRSITIGGFAGRFKDRAWDTVDAALEEARQERLGGPAAAIWSSSPAGAALRQIDVSELVLHTDAAQDAWMMIGDKIYDLTRFLHRHPGGLKILSAYLGMDATHAYRAVQHHLCPAAGALLARHQIGVVRPVDYCSASLAEAALVWRNALFLVVEMENALRLDAAIHQCATVGWRPAADAPYTLQLLLEAHRRFMSSYAQGLAEPLQQVWVIACKLGGAHDEGDQLGRALAAVLQGPSALAIQAHLAAWERDLTNGDPSTYARRAAATVRLLQDADMALLLRLKGDLREGLRVFETYGRATAARGGQLLHAICQRIPQCYEAFFDEAWVALQEPCISPSR